MSSCWWRLHPGFPGVDPIYTLTKVLQNPVELTRRFWSNYSDLTRPHPKWWFSREHPLISGKPRSVKYYNLARRLKDERFHAIIRHVARKASTAIWRMSSHSMQPILNLCLAKICCRTNFFCRDLPGDGSKDPEKDGENHTWNSSLFSTNSDLVNYRRENERMSPEKGLINHQKGMANFLPTSIFYC